MTDLRDLVKNEGFRENFLNPMTELVTKDNDEEAEVELVKKGNKLMVIVAGSKGVATLIYEQKERDDDDA